MKIELYINIRKKLKELIKGTPFEGKVLFVGGCCRDELMGLEIKDIDMAVTCPWVEYVWRNGFRKTNTPRGKSSHTPLTRQRCST